MLKISNEIASIGSSECLEHILVDVMANTLDTAVSQAELDNSNSRATKSGVVFEPRNGIMRIDLEIQICGSCWHRQKYSVAKTIAVTAVFISQPRCVA